MHSSFLHVLPIFQKYNISYYPGCLKLLPISQYLLSRVASTAAIFPKITLAVSSVLLQAANFLFLSDSDWILLQAANFLSSVAWLRLTLSLFLSSTGCYSLRMSANFQCSSWSCEFPSFIWLRLFDCYWLLQAANFLSSIADCDWLWAPGLQLTATDIELLTTTDFELLTVTISLLLTSSCKFLSSNTRLRLTSSIWAFSVFFFKVLIFSYDKGLKIFFYLLREKTVINIQKKSTYGGMTKIPASSK